MTRLAAILAALTALLSATDAAAQPGRVCTGGEIVVDDGDIVDLRINPGTVTAVYFAGPIERLDVPDLFKLEVTDRGDHVTVHPQILPRGIDELGSFTVDTAAGTVSVALRAASSPADADERCRVIPRDYRRWDIELAREADKLCADRLTAQSAALAVATLELDKLRRRVTDGSGRRDRWAALGEILAIRERVPIHDEVPRAASGEVFIRVTSWLVSAAYRYLEFEIHNDTTEPYHVARFDVLDFRGRPNGAQRVELDGPLAGILPDAIGVVPPLAHIKGIVAIKHTANLGASVRLFMSQDRGHHPVIRNDVPTLEQARRDMERHDERQRRTHEAQGRIAIHAQTVGGVAWLYAGGGDQSQAATSLIGAGVRVAYSFNPLFALEVDAFGGRSGDATFRRDGPAAMPEQITRSASFGRLQLGGALRLGHDIIPTARLGLIAQGSSYRTQVTTGEGDAAVDAAFRFDTLLSFGIGLDVRLGEHLLAGVGVSATTPIGSDDLARGIEGGLHVGYGWKRSENY